MVVLRLVSTATSGSTISVEPTTSVGDTRSRVAATLGLAANLTSIILNFRGAVLHDDAATWEVLEPKDNEKLYVAIDTSANAGTAANRGIGAVRPMSDPAAGRPGGAPGMPDMAPEQIEMLMHMVTPAFIDAMINSVPELRRLSETAPDAIRELRDPEVFKSMLRSQLDPESRRQFQRNQAHQLAQVSNVPGGWGMVERMLHSVNRDADAAQRGEDAADATVVTSSCEPLAGHTSNNVALPNPWTRPPPPQVPPPPPAETLVPAATQSTTGYIYDRQLRILTAEMGFDEDIARLALNEAGGDVDRAVVLLDQWME